MFCLETLCASAAVSFACIHVLSHCIESVCVCLTLIVFTRHATCVFNAVIPPQPFVIMCARPQLLSVFICFCSQGFPGGQSRTMGQYWGERCQVLKFCRWLDFQRWWQWRWVLWVVTNPSKSLPPPRRCLTDPGIRYWRLMVSETQLICAKQCCNIGDSIWQSIAMFRNFGCISNVSKLYFVKRWLHLCARYWWCIVALEDLWRLHWELPLQASTHQPRKQFPPKKISSNQYSS